MPRRQHRLQPQTDSLPLQRPRVPGRPPPVAMASSLAAFHSAAGHVPHPRRQQGASHGRASSLLRLLHLPPEPLPRRRSRRVAAEVRLDSVIRFKNGPLLRRCDVSRSRTFAVRDWRSWHNHRRWRRRRRPQDEGRRGHRRRRGRCGAA